MKKHNEHHWIFDGMNHPDMVYVHVLWHLWHGVPIFSHCTRHVSCCGVAKLQRGCGSRTCKEVALYQWVGLTGLTENLHRKPRMFPMKYRDFMGFPVSCFHEY